MDISYLLSEEEVRKKKKAKHEKIDYSDEEAQLLSRLPCQPQHLLLNIERTISNRFIRVYGITLVWALVTNAFVNVQGFQGLAEERHHKLLG